MPKTRNYSQREQRDAMDLLDIHDDISVVHMLTGIQERTLRRWRKKLRRRQNATLSEKSLTLSEKRTKSDNVLPARQPVVNQIPAPAAIQPQANANAAPDDSDDANSDLQSLRHIRAKLMIFARRLADDLDPDDPDVNLRTLSLTRILDRIYWLDEILYSGEDEEEVHEPDPPNRIEIVFDGQVHEHPPWHGATQKEDS